MSNKKVVISVKKQMSCVNGGYIYKFHLKVAKTLWNCCFELYC